MAHPHRFFRLLPYAMLLVLLSMIVSSAAIQGQTNYKPPSNTGKIPEVFRTKATQLFEASKEALENNPAKQERRRTRKLKEQFYLNSHFSLQRLFKSGKVLYGDSMTRYVQKVADQLLAHQPNLKGKMQFFVVKSPAVNAFASDLGYIFVTVGLLAHIKNEAELAFTLGHEISHYRHQHSTNTLLKRDAFIRGKGSRGESSYGKLLKFHSFSREHELEADGTGLDILTKAGYNPAAAHSMLDILALAQYPYQDIPFDTAFFNDRNLEFYGRYWPDTVPFIEIEEDEDDTLATHPNVSKRKSALDAKDTKGDGAFYKVGEKEFKAIRKIARNELSRIMLYNLDYEGAFYNAYVILQEEPQNSYQQFVIAKSLVAMSTYINSEYFKYIHRRPSKVKGEFHTLVHFIDELEPRELNFLALRYCLQMLKKYPKHPYLLQDIRTMIDQLAKYHIRSIDEITDQDLESPEAIGKLAKLKELAITQSSSGGIDDGEIIVTNRLDGTTTKPSKKRKKSDEPEKKEIKTAKDAYTTSLSGYKEVYPSLFTELTTAVKKEQKEIKDWEAISERKQKKIQRKRYKKERKVVGRAFEDSLTIDKIVFIDPNYYKVDLRKKDKFKFIDGEKAQAEYLKLLEQVANDVGLEATFLGFDKLEENDTKEFNQVSLLYEIIEERTDQPFRRLTMMEPQVAQELIKKYGTKYFGLTNIANVRYKEPADVRFTRGVATFYKILIFPFAIPSTIIYSVYPTTFTTFLTEIYDIETGNLVYSFKTETRLSDKSDLQGMYVYENFKTIKDLGKR
jgi:beta-barrel assembly-enhancing protease